MGMPGAVLARATRSSTAKTDSSTACSRSSPRSRAALESEQREASRLRAESEAVRAEYRERVERLPRRAATSSTTRCAASSTTPSARRTRRSRR